MKEPASKRQRTGSEELEDSASSASSQSGVARVPFSLSALEAEIESLRENPPEYVCRVGHLHRPSLVCRADGKVGPPHELAPGPWDLIVVVSGAQGDAAYGYPFRISLRFTETLWPMKFALVRFRCVFHHALTEESGSMMFPFYNALPKDERGAATLRLMLQHVRTFLVDPVSSWKFSSATFSPELTQERLEQVLASQSQMNAARFDVIKKYREQVLHPELFTEPASWRDDWLEPSFREARRAGSTSAWRSILTEHLPGEVYSFKMVTDEFCDKLVAELFNFYASGLPAKRPNSMNNYGVVLNEIGLEALMDELQQMLQPLGELLWPGPGSCWDGHHCFVVRYRAGEDLGLDMHTDDSDVTFNLCLGLDFKGAGLQFCGKMGAPDHRKHSHTYQHVRGSCVCHLGRKRHGADDTTSGERLNVILWNHSSTYRQSDESKRPPYRAEIGPPDEVCVSYTHDRDFGNFKTYPAGKESFRGRGWCPRPTFEYAGFRADCEKESSCCCCDD